MNIALVIAGGKGNRTHQDIPKQFIHVHDKPIFIYTLEEFQKHPLIDAIEVVCLDGWQEVVRSYARQFGIAKLDNVVIGGDTGLLSIRNGLWDLETRYNSEDDIVLIHDAIRPMVTQEIITNNIKICRQNGNAVTAIPCTSAMLKTFDGETANSQVARDNLKITQTPQTFFLKEILEVHREAIKTGIDDSIASCSLYVELGRELYLVNGAEKNIKITTSEDIEIFTAMLELEKPKWMH